MMSKLTFNPKAHFDPYKIEKDRRAHERGLEHKALHKMGVIEGPFSVSSRGRSHKPKPVTLAPVTFK